MATMASAPESPAAVRAIEELDAELEHAGRQPVDGLARLHLADEATLALDGE